VHIVSLRPELEGLIVPSKFYGVAAVARPTIFVGSRSGEIGRILFKNACGLTVESGDGPKLAAAIAELASDRDRCHAMGECARAYCEAASNKKCAIEIWHEIVSAS
jgi:colanic acid biosynthesis glycosyl transferase WcaI